MFRNLLWLLIGGAVVAFLVYKWRDLKRRTTPAAMAEKLDRTRQSMGARISEFIDTAREASTERETELRDALGLTEDGQVTQP
ncbi:hypothetical protein [Enemella sp. A6]|uniref:hypothetical protein n=1 Tax=Enemella sp. A6 TaxID=3440152 RepID=UPI003EBDE853